MKVRVKCSRPRCRRTFSVKPYDLKRGRGIYCSRKCYHLSQIETPRTFPDRGARQTVRRRCSICRRTFRPKKEYDPKYVRYCDRCRRDVIRELAPGIRYFTGGHGGAIITEKYQ